MRGGGAGRTPVRRRMPFSLIPRGIWLPVVLILCLTLVLRTREYDEKSIDAQVLLRLASLGVMGISSVGLLLRRDVLGDWRVWAWLVFLACLLLTSSYSPNPVVSLIYAGSQLVIFAYMAWLVEEKGEGGCVDVLLWSGGLIALLSLLAYAVAPSMATMQGWNGVSFGDVGRLRGLTPSGNAIGGLVSAMLLLLALYPERVRRAAGPRLFIPALCGLGGLFLLCLFLSGHRNGPLTAAIAFSACYVLSRNTGVRLLAVLSVLLPVALVAAYHLNDILVLLARSGDASEITSATGRTAIWEVALEFIAASPYWGYGYSSSTFILPKDPRLFSVAAHAHNMYLELAFSGGLVAVGLFALAALTAVLPLRRGELRPLAMLLFILMRGTTEATPFNGISDFSALCLWFAVYAMIRAKRRDAAASREGRRRRIALSLVRPQGWLRGKAGPA